MTKEILQNALNEKGIKAKVLSVKKTEFNDYEIIFTFDLNYEGRIEYENIIEPEDDVLVEDLEDAVFEIERKYNA